MSDGGTVAPPPPLNLRLLGTLDVAGTAAGVDDPHPLLRQPKRTAVLVYMLLEATGGMVARDRLVDLFWPSGDERRGRTSLRQTLTYLRGCLPPESVLRRGNTAVGIDRDRVSCDVLRFRELLEAGRPSDALELYRGDLLEGFVVDAGPRFERWLEDRRSDLRERAADEAWGLASRAESRDHRAEAAFWGKRALALSLFDESTVQRLMGLLARVGNRSGVLRAYRGLEERLAREGREPEPLTRRIAEEVRALDPEDSSSRIESGGGRRSGVDRRSGSDRRRGAAGWSGRERRSGEDRRSGRERRSGEDRRETG